MGKSLYRSLSELIVTIIVASLVFIRSTFSSKFLSKLINSFFILNIIWLTNCSLNDSEKSLGPKTSSNSEDIDFNWDLWPELEENKSLQAEKLMGWPELKDNSILFLGDESLSANWGLMIEKSFLGNKYLDKKLNPWFLSTCMSARDFKNGLVSSCGYYSLPFKQEIITGLYVTMNQTENTERLAPKIISDEKVKVVVISFGHRIAAMDDPTEIQQELSAIELMAKWAHSSGKKCYVIEPVDGYFVETAKNDFLNEDQKSRLKVSVQDYCEWIDSLKLRSDYSTSGQIALDEILDSNMHNTTDDFFPVPSPQLHINSNLPDMNIDGIEIPKNNLNPEDQVLEESEGLSKSIRPKPRPELVSRKAQEQIRERLESQETNSDLSVVAQQEGVVPKYLWNGHNNGQALTDIGMKYLVNNAGSYLVKTKSLRDVENFCPRYWDLSLESRKYFWLYLFSAVARYENEHFNPKALHKEKSSGRHSIGIFQVDTKNCGYGSDSNKASLYDMDNNFKCALTKASGLVKAGKQVADGKYSGKTYTDFGMDGYWSVLRKPYVGAAMNKSTGSYENVSLGRREKIMQLTNSIKICK